TPEYRTNFKGFAIFCPLTLGYRTNFKGFAIFCPLTLEYRTNFKGFAIFCPLTLESLTNFRAFAIFFPLPPGYLANFKRFAIFCPLTPNIGQISRDSPFSVRYHSGKSSALCPLLLQSRASSIYFPNFVSPRNEDWPPYNPLV